MAGSGLPPPAQLGAKLFRSVQRRGNAQQADNLLYLRRQRLYLDRATPLVPVMRFLQCLLASVIAATLVAAHEGHHHDDLVQYCLIDQFCIAHTVFANPATNEHDVYFTLHVDGFDNSGHGWQGVGLGTAMQGALMFVIYGNPVNQEQPTLSVRTTRERHQAPASVSDDYAKGVEVQVVYAKWAQTGDAYRAELNCVCYNCTLWPGTTVDANSTAQPWIWAHNPSQAFETFSDDAPLEMHSKDSGSGYGFFFTNMALSLTKSDAPPGFPTINAEKGSSGASLEASGVAATSPRKKSAFRHRAWQVHGFLLTVAYLIVYPLAVVLLRRKSEHAFKLHWITQVVASVLTALGVLLGVYLHPEIEHLHQIVGLALVVAPVVQILLGWRHHIIYLRIGRSTKFAEVHVTLGRVVLGLGAVNILLGMALKHWSAWMIVLVALVALAEAAGLAVLVFRVQKPKRGQKYAQLHTDEHDGAFALDDVDSLVDESDDEGEKREKGAERRGRMSDER